MTNLLGICTKSENLIKKIKALTALMTVNSEFKKIKDKYYLLLRLNQDTTLKEALHRINEIIKISDESFSTEIIYLSHSRNKFIHYYVLYPSIDENTPQLNAMKPYKKEIIKNRPLLIWRDIETKSEQHIPLIQDCGIHLKSAVTGEMSIFGFFAYQNDSTYSAVCGKWKSPTGIFAEAKTIKRLMKKVREKLSDKGFEIIQFDKAGSILQIKEMEEYLEKCTKTK